MLIYHRLSAIFGAIEFHYSFGEYQAELSSLWGSIAYLFSGLLQWYEAINKRPAVDLFDHPGEMRRLQVHAG